MRTLKWFNQLLDLEKLTQAKQWTSKSWAFLRDFATIRSNPLDISTEDTPKVTYEQKVRLYAFLPALEEQRDWLENMYQKARLIGESRDF